MRDWSNISRWQAVADGNTDCEYAPHPPARAGEAERKEIFSAGCTEAGPIPKSSLLTCFAASFREGRHAVGVELLLDEGRSKAKQPRRFMLRLRQRKGRMHERGIVRRDCVPTSKPWCSRRISSTRMPSGHSSTCSPRTTICCHRNRCRQRTYGRNRRGTEMIQSVYHSWIRLDQVSYDATHILPAAGFRTFNYHDACTPSSDQEALAKITCSNAEVIRPREACTFD